jgi:hypothetical protein
MLLLIVSFGFTALIMAREAPSALDVLHRPPSSFGARAIFLTSKRGVDPIHSNHAPPPTREVYRTMHDVPSGENPVHNGSPPRNRFHPNTRVPGVPPPSANTPVHAGQPPRMANN